MSALHALETTEQRVSAWVSRKKSHRVFVPLRVPQTIEADGIDPAYALGQCRGGYTAVNMQQAFILRVAPSNVNKVPLALKNDQVIIGWSATVGLLDQTLSWKAFRKKTPRQSLRERKKSPSGRCCCRADAAICPRHEDR